MNAADIIAECKKITPDFDCDLAFGEDGSVLFIAMCSLRGEQMEYTYDLDPHLAACLRSIKEKAK